MYKSFLRAVHRNVYTTEVMARKIVVTRAVNATALRNFGPAKLTACTERGDQRGAVKVLDVGDGAVCVGDLDCERNVRGGLKLALAGGLVSRRSAASSQ